MTGPENQPKKLMIQFVYKIGSVTMKGPGNQLNY